MFADWVVGAFIENVLAYEGQYLISQDTTNDLEVIFIRDNRQESKE